jgi:hypothetical protein
MKLRLALATLSAAAALVTVVPTAQASGICYDVQATVNGQDVVNEAGCQDLP